MLYALMTPEKTIVEETVDVDRSSAWGLAYEYLSEKGCGNLLAVHRDGLEHEIDSAVPQSRSKYYCRRYWKDIKGSMDYARKHGFRIVAVKVVPVETT